MATWTKPASPADGQASQVKAPAPPLSPIVTCTSRKGPVTDVKTAISREERTSDKRGIALQRYLVDAWRPCANARANRHVERRYLGAWGLGARIHKAWQENEENSNTDQAWHHVSIHALFPLNSKHSLRNLAKHLLIETKERQAPRTYA